MCVVLEVNSLLWSGNVATVCVAKHRKADGFLSWICPLFNYFPTLSFKVYNLIALPLKELLLFSETHSKWGTMTQMNLFPKLWQRETALCIPAELAKFVVQRQHKDSLYCNTELQPMTSRRRGSLSITIWETLGKRIQASPHLYSCSMQLCANVDYWVRVTSHLWFSVWVQCQPCCRFCWLFTDWAGTPHAVPHVEIKVGKYIYCVASWSNSTLVLYASTWCTFFSLNK